VTLVLRSRYDAAITATPGDIRRGQALPKFNLDEFIAWENAQPERHEFVRGEVFAMVGARRVHNEVVSNLCASLNALPP
jgi:Uma2 family endonuclease